MVGQAAADTPKLHPDAAQQQAAVWRSSVSTRVLRSLESPEATHCVDIFVRADGTFGFEEYRRDHEDQRGWFPLLHYSTLIFETEDDALAQAKARVAWLFAMTDKDKPCS